MTSAGQDCHCPSPNGCEICSWEDHKWAQVARSLFQKLPLPQDVFEYLSGGQGVVVPYGCKGDLFAGENVATFSNFSMLPLELRRHIWKLAVESRVFQVSPARFQSVLNCPKSLSPPAHVCREARQAVRELGQSFSISASTERTRDIWLSVDDIFYISQLDLDSLEMDDDLVLKDFRHLALSFTDLQMLADITDEEDYGGFYLRCLREASNLQSLIVVINENHISLSRDQRDSELISSEDEYRSLFDLVMLEDTHRLQALMDLFARPDNPCRGYVNDKGITPYGATGDFLKIWQPGLAHTRNCLDCARKMWEEHYIPRVKGAWLRIVASEAQARDRDIFPLDGDFNPGNAWVTAMLKSMPEIRPAVSLKISWDCTS